MFAKSGIKVTVRDIKTREKMGELANTLTEMGVTLILGEDYLNGLSNTDIIIRSPGIYYNTPELIEARGAGVIVTSEMELFFELCPCKIIAVTGSEGKTTTSTLISCLITAAGKTVYLGGNIGRALLPLVPLMSPDDICVVELSSFQLISMRKGPHISVITNITPNHLNVHKSMDEYIAAKQNIYLHQDAFSETILNLDNELTASFAPEIRGRLMYFSRRKKPENGAYMDDNGGIHYIRNGHDTFIMNREEIFVPGLHNVENYLAAICAVWDLVTPEHIIEVARNFKGVEHRQEFVREYNGIRFYNDSKATTVSSARSALSVFDQRVIHIAGGYDKHVPFTELASSVAEKVKLLILMGDTAEKIRTAILDYPGYSEKETKIVRVDGMREAVYCALQHAVSGDIVLLSPACASFDMYTRFEERGEHFKRLVMELGHEQFV